MATECSRQGGLGGERPASLKVHSRMLAWATISTFGPLKAAGTLDVGGPRLVRSASRDSGSVTSFAIVRAG
jgi:hypothetical protein